ncbi:unnamed protein product [Cuscuta campestris]|uniref:Tf2-1-like SH3-like domain-containing protein n=1 Tax=Cuscuta campestris TaxID=132261 RepID=A0A484NRE1_9ASTE|nr:unnamed protein product [Cuscuta campestris]
MTYLAGAERVPLPSAALSPLISLIVSAHSSSSALKVSPSFPVFMASSDSTPSIPAVDPAVVCFEEMYRQDSSLRPDGPMGGIDHSRVLSAVPLRTSVTVVSSSQAPPPKKKKKSKVVQGRTRKSLPVTALKTGPITRVADATLISVFTAGLKPTIRRGVLLRRPITLGKAFILARELAANHADTFTTVAETVRHPCKVQQVDEFLTERTTVLADVKRNLVDMQQRMTSQANRHRRDVEFKVGDEVLLKLQPYRQFSVARPQSAKLARRYYGPFSVLERISKVAYKLQLPPGSRIHDVFHVSLLRPFVQGDSSCPVAALPKDFHGGAPILVPTWAISSRTVLVAGVPMEQWLIEWSDGSSADATWEPTDHIRESYPTLVLEDKDVLEAGVNDTVAMTEEEVQPIQPRRSGRMVKPPVRFKDFV